MAHLSPDDFTRLQNQLLDLKEKNYSLEDTLRKNRKELTDTKAHIHALQEENVRYQSLIKTSKKAGEVELLVRDNGYLRNKLKDQEEDFRLQNNTLLKELSKLVGENEQYERQIKVLCSSQSSDVAEGDYGSTDDSKEVIRLRGELKDVHTKLFEAETRVKTESQAHAEKVLALSSQLTRLTNILQTHSIPLDEGEINLGKGGGVSFTKLSLQDDDGLEADPERTSDTFLQSQDKCSQLQREMERMQTQLREEKELTASLTAEKARLEERVTSSSPRECVEELKESLEEAKSKLMESQSTLAEKSKQHDTTLKSLELLQHKLEATEEALQESRKAVLQKEKECEVLTDRIESATKDISQTLEQKERIEKENSEFQLKVKAQESEVAALNGSLVEQRKFTENQHSLMERLKADMEAEKQQQKQALDQVMSRHKEETATLSSQNHHLKTKLEEMNGKVSEMNDISGRVTQLEQENLKLNECNEKLLEEVKAAQRQVQEEADRVAAERCQEIETIQWQHTKEKSDLQTQLEISTIQRQEAEDAVEALKRKVADGEEEQRIHERKGVTLMKDLKKQLLAERKRADRLQEKLSQLLTDPSQLTAITTVSEAGDDVSSVSSWSLVSGEPRDSSTRENSIIASPQDSPPPGLVAEETVSLVNRLTELQQHKWQLEERITHLESSSAAMADDLIKKSAIIQHFCMEHKHSEGTGSPPTSPQHPTLLGDKLNVRRVLEMMRGGAGEESLKEINRRLQNLLEETLGKNMQLHKDVENLSQQVHQLSKLAAVKTEAESPVSVDAVSFDEGRAEQDTGKS